MRIAHVVRRLSFDDWGGTEQVVWNLANAQRAAGHDVRVFATTALWREGAGPDIPRFRPIYPWFPMSRRLAGELDRKGGNPFVPGLGRALREWRPDVIHCHAMARIAELCLRTARAVGAKTVISLHGGGAGVPDAEARSLKAPTRGLLPWGKAIDILMGWTRRIPEDFGGIVCVGEDEYDHWRTRHPHVLFLPNGVDTALYAGLAQPGSPSAADSAAEAVSPAGSAAEASPSFKSVVEAAPSASLIKSLCVARIDRQKNQMLLVEALARNPALSVRLVGPATQPDYLEALKARAAELGVSGRFSYAGALPPGSPELLAEYRAADIFVLPSRHEPFGIVVLEAWAAGLPVLASDVGGLGRLCAAHPAAAIVFGANDPASLDAALSEAMRRRGTGGLREMSEAGRRAARQYDWSALSARLVGFYCEI